MTLCGIKVENFHLFGYLCDFAVNSTTCCMALKSALSLSLVVLIHLFCEVIKGGHGQGQVPSKITRNSIYFYL